MIPGMTRLRRSPGKSPGEGLTGCYKTMLSRSIAFECARAAYNPFQISSGADVVRQIRAFGGRSDHHHVTVFT